MVTHLGPSHILCRSFFTCVLVRLISGFLLYSEEQQKGKHRSLQNPGIVNKIIPSTRTKASAFIPYESLKLHFTITLMKRRSDQRAASSCSSDSEQPLWKRRKSAPVESLPTTHQQTATRRLLPCPPLTPTTSDQIAEVLHLPKSSQNTHSNQEFNIFSALLKHPDLILYFARFLHLPTLVNLYSISKPFHWIVSARFMAVVHGQIAINAPLASRCWHWRLYIDLCMRDPGRRIRESKAGYAKNETVQLEDIEMPFSRRHRALGSNRLGSNQRSPEKTVSPRKKATVTITDIRGIPSLRYLAMVAFRQGVVEDIVALFAREGIPLPDRIEETLAKMWSLIDVPYSTRRVGLHVQYSSLE